MIVVRVIDIIYNYLFIFRGKIDVVIIIGVELEWVFRICEL